MQEAYLGNTTSAALRVVKSLYGAAATTQIITEGHENLVVIVNEQYVVRFPRTAEVWRSSQAERYVLEKLSTMPDMPVPKILATSEDPAYIVASYLQGKQLTAEQIRRFSPSALKQVGTEMANFAYTLHSRLSVAEIQPQLVPHTWSYDDYLRRVLFERQDPNPQIDALAKRYYDAWQHKQDYKTLVIHDDLHTGNLLFNQDHSFSVLDFGAVCIGSAEQELRQVYRLGTIAFEAAISRYEELSGKPLNRELAKLWTITQELAAYCREDSGPIHERAAENLAFWFPELLSC